MPLPIASILIPVLSELGYAVIDGFIESDSASKLAKFAFDLAGQGLAGKVALEALLDEVKAKKAAAAEAGEVWVPSLEEIEAKLDEIKARGAEDGTYGPVS